MGAIEKKLDEICDRLTQLEKSANNMEIKTDRIWNGVRPVIDKVLEL